MYFVAVACAANIGLDYLFIGGLDMGPAGAALGTTLSQALSVVVSLVFITRQKVGLSLQKDCFRPRREVLAPILRVGVPVALQDGFVQVSFILITIIANNRGLNDAAAVGIVEKVISFVFLVPSSMLSTVSALAAQNVGAGKDDRAARTLRYACTLCLAFGLAVGVAVQFAAGGIVAPVRQHPRRGDGGQPVHPQLYLGLYVCRGAFQLLRLLLRLWPVGHLVCPHALSQSPGADPRGLFHEPAVPRHSAAHGLRGGCGLAFVGADLRGGPRMAAPARRLEICGCSVKKFTLFS